MGVITFSHYGYYFVVFRVMTLSAIDTATTIITIMIVVAIGIMTVVFAIVAVSILITVPMIIKSVSFLGAIVDCDRNSFSVH